MTTDGWAKLVRYVTCAWAVFSASTATLPQVILGCSAMVAEDYDG